MEDESWIRGPVIGRGATATVSLASSLADPHRIFALKSSHIPSASALLRNEHAILSKIGPHPNLITSLGIHVSREGRCNLWTEYVPGGTLADRIRTNQLKHPKLIPFYSRQILMGLEFLHANGVVHCDIKSENVLVCDDGSLKIADLGFSKAEEMLPPTFSGTPAFMAPEVARGEAQGFPADIWALGCTIVEMSTGKSPWPEETNPVSALYRIGFSVDIPCIPASLSEQAGLGLGVAVRRELPTSSKPSRT
uniref:Protein kinase domain-containing protein n=1 Tax=Kalanchoe fedtschenkoi TaxID=63787 RepID=A0A7N1A898_KALFE